MASKHSLWLFILALLMSTAGIAVGADSAGKTFRTLTIGFTTYTNVTVTDVSGGSIFLRHSRGFESIQIESLSPEVRQKLGMPTPQPEPLRRQGVEPAAARPTQAPALESGSPRPSWKQRVEGISHKSLSVGETAIAIGLPLFALVLMIVGAIWLIIAAFRVSAGWGICCLLGSFLCGLLNLIFVFCNWNEARKPFFCYLGGVALLCASAVVVPNLVNRTESPQSTGPTPAVRARSQ